MQQDTMGWRATAERLNQAWDLVILSQYLLVFSALKQVFPVTGQRGESCEEGSKRQHPPPVPHASRASGMLRSLFSHAKIKVGKDSAGAKAG